MAKKRNKENGNSIIVVMLAILLLTAIVVKIYNVNFMSNDLRQLSSAKNIIMKEVQWTGGLTNDIIQDAKNILANTDYDPASISITSPQGLDPKLPMGSKIEIYITAATKPQGGMNNLLQPNTETHTHKAYGLIVSQYYP